jgi:hypothetical protein
MQKDESRKIVPEQPPANKKRRTKVFSFPQRIGIELKLMGFL